MNKYSFDTILVNGNEMQLTAIVNETIAPLSEFERETFSFIKSWLKDTREFNLQTSGSTGAPKIITFTRSQMEQSARATIKALALSQRDTALVCLHTKFIAGKMMLVRAFINNMRVIVAEPSANPLKEIPAETTIDFAAFVPLQLKTMLDEGFEKRLNTIKTILLGGSPVSNLLRKQIEVKLKNQLFTTYGMTETISHIGLEKLSRDEGIYHTLPGIKIRQDSRGCLIIEAPYLTSPVHTNDIVEITSKSSFRWLGRIDNVINSGGVKINPEKIEVLIEDIFQRLYIHQQYFITGLPDSHLGEKIVLVIEGNPLHDSVKEALNKHFNTLGKFEKPKEIFTLKHFTYTATNKVNRPETLKILKKRGGQKK